MIGLRSIIAPALESRLGTPLRRQLALSRARRDSTGTALRALSAGSQLLSLHDLAPEPTRVKPPELFILGSGPSVLELTTAQMERMRVGTTIGLNSWVLHEFIPDAYSFEEMENDHYVHVAQGLSGALARADIAARSPLILHLRPRINTPSRRLISIPAASAGNVRYYGRVAVETRLKRNLEGDLVALIRAQRASSIASHVLIDSGFSVARMLSLAIARGYASVILVGIDLNSSRYFFEDDPSYLARYNLADFNPWLSRSMSHDTEETTNRNFAASEFLPALARASEMIGGPRIFVASSSSLLAEHLPTFHW